VTQSYKRHGVAAKIDLIQQRDETMAVMHQMTVDYRQAINDMRIECKKDTELHISDLKLKKQPVPFDS
jgi:hypothetical protein